MRKKILLLIISVLLISSFVFFLVSCDEKNSTSNENSNVTVIQGADGKDGADGQDGKDGKDGREVEFNVSKEYIQWRYVGDTIWKNLIALENLKGQDGEDGEDGKDGRDGLSINPSGDTTDSCVGVVANTLCAASVARIYMYETSTSTKYSGLASAFLITDYSTSTPERYLITNAHCCRYLDLIETRTKSSFGMQSITYSLEWKSFGKILCYFENDNTEYTTQIVAYGSYDDTTYDDYVQYYRMQKPVDNDQPDLAILKITGTQPSNEDHPSLSIASSLNTVKRGDPVAIIGNPEGMGTTNSISTGVISQTGITISSWGAGTFNMTDVAINGGNSGGPMIDCYGKVVGVVESKLVATDIDNMGFALDSNTLISFIDWVETQNSITINEIIA